jgi:hypothetical protein
VFAPVNSQTAFEETVDRLGTAIKLGLLAPGDRVRPRHRAHPRGTAATRMIGVGPEALDGADGREYVPGVLRTDHQPL